MNKELIAIFEYLEREKGIKRETIVSAIKESILTAAKKSCPYEEISVNVDDKTGNIEVFTEKTIVEKVKNPNEEIDIEEALELAPDCKIGQRLEISIPPEEFGRIAAQAAKGVISQKLREAEKDIIYEEYRDRVNEIISGTIKRFLRGRTMIVDLGKVEAILPDRHYPRTEKYQTGEKVLALLLEVRDTDMGGAEVILSRSHPSFVAALFSQEVPELADGTIKIEKIVREAGYRTKMAVSSTDPKVDPVGTCVGVRGTRIKNIIRELKNEKIDVIPFSEDHIKLLKNATSPIEILRYKESDDSITIIINDEDYPAIIGKRGMNAKLMSALIEKEFQAKKISEYKKLVNVQVAELSESDNPILDEPLKIDTLSNLILEELKHSGYDTIRKILKAPQDELIKSTPGINYLDLMEKILEQVE
jgi:N utilization substance protein A